MGRLKNGKVIFAPHTAPGDITELDIILENKGFIRGAVRRILIPSPDRRDPPCPYYLSCGGCNLMHIKYEAQLKIKSAMTADIFSRIGKINISQLKITQSPLEFHYKNRMQFHTDHYGKTGLKRKRDNEVIPVSRCMIAVEAINNWLKINGSGLRKGKISLFAVDDESVFTDREKVEIFVKTGRKKIRADSALFFQTNLAMLPDFIEYVTAGLKGNSALDMYCGVGMFASCLRENHRHVTGVEACREAEPYFLKNAGEDSLFIGKSVEAVEKYLNSEKWDTVVVDPPRKGLSKAARDILMRLKPEKCVYVSCNPVTQARDIHHMFQSGYDIEEIRLFDFYPQTSHIESVVKLKYNGDVGNDKKNMPVG